MDVIMRDNDNMKLKNFIMILMVILIVGLAWWLMEYASSRSNAPESTSENNTSSSLLTYADIASGVTFQYPEKLETKYISVVDWPPKVQITNPPFACTPAGLETDRAGETKKVVVNGNTYCITKVVEGAAGSMCTQYAYAFLKNGSVPIMTFTLKSVQCANYDEPSKSECETERSSFNIDPTIDKIANSLNFE